MPIMLYLFETPKCDKFEKEMIIHLNIAQLPIYKIID